MTIHDTLAKLESVRENLMQNVAFTYKKCHEDATGMWAKELTFSLPKNTKELCLWGEQLKNCLCSYGDAIHLGRSTIYGIFNHQKLIFAIELDSDNEIIQSSTFHNKALNDKDKEILLSWHQKY